MNKKLTKNILLASLIATGLHFLGTVLLTALQNVLKSPDDVPGSVLEIFTMPWSDLICSFLNLALIALFSLLMIKNWGKRQTALPLCAMIWGGFFSFVIDKAAYRIWGDLTLRTAEQAINYSYLSNKLAHLDILSVMATALLLIGASFAFASSNKFKN